MAPTKKYDEDFVRRMHAEYQAGLSSIDLSVRYGIDKAYVLRLFQKHSLPARPPGRARRGTGDSKEIARLYEAGQSIEVIARHFNLASGHVRDVLADSGITLRIKSHGKKSESRLLVHVVCFALTRGEIDRMQAAGLLAVTTEEFDRIYLPWKMQWERAKWERST